MLMAHKGKVVFETYPGMNPLDMHVWMSASKTTVGLLVSMLADAGKVDLEKPIPDYVPELKGTAWDKVSVKNTMNMAVALDNEETFESLTNPTPGSRDGSRPCSVSATSSRTAGAR
jgi:CubicO group peptidase (beta-lactamase class C family)